MSSLQVPSDDYIAIEMSAGRPRVIVDLGDVPMVLTAPGGTAANGEWHRVQVTRTGRLLTLSVTSEGTVGKHNTSTVSVLMDGSRQVLNLHQNVSRFYIGGVPDSSTVCACIAHTRTHHTDAGNHSLTPFCRTH
jgi:hypothetical protein